MKKSHLFLSIPLLFLMLGFQSQNIQAQGNYPDLVSLFKEWRAFENHREVMVLRIIQQRPLKNVGQDSKRYRQNYYPLKLQPGLLPSGLLVD